MTEPIGLDHWGSAGSLRMILAPARRSVRQPTILIISLPAGRQPCSGRLDHSSRATQADVRANARCAKGVRCSRSLIRYPAAITSGVAITRTEWACADGS
jgi:hypothetical protein